MRIFRKIGGLAGRRLFSAGLTLAGIAVLAAAAVVMAPRASVPTSAEPQHGVVAVSYRIADEADLEMLSDDLDRVRAFGLDFILPSETGRAGMIVIIESCPDPNRVLALLKAKNARAAFIQNGVREDDAVRLIAEAAEEGVVEPAIALGSIEDPVAFSKALSRAKLEFALRYRTSCACFVHTGLGKLTAECFEAGGTAAPVVFTYGSGVNPITDGAEHGVRLLTRVVRLPDWSIETYFQDVVGLGRLSSPFASRGTTRRSRRP